MRPAVDHLNKQVCPIHNHSPQATYINGDISMQVCCEEFNEILEREMKIKTMEITKEAMKYRRHPN